MLLLSEPNAWLPNEPKLPGKQCIGPVSPGSAAKLCCSCSSFANDFCFLLSPLFWMAVLPSRWYTRHGSKIRADAICPMSGKFVLVHFVLILFAGDRVVSLLYRAN